MRTRARCCCKVGIFALWSHLGMAFCLLGGLKRLAFPQAAPRSSVAVSAWSRRGMRATSCEFRFSSPHAATAHRPGDTRKGTWSENATSHHASAKYVKVYCIKCNTQV